MATSFGTQHEQAPTRLLNYRPPATYQSPATPDYHYAPQDTDRPGYARRIGIGVDPRKLWAGGALFPFSTTAALEGKIPTAVVNLAIGITAGVLVSGVAKRSAR